MKVIVVFVTAIVDLTFCPPKPIKAGTLSDGTGNCFTVSLVAVSIFCKEKILNKMLKDYN